MESERRVVVIGSGPAGAMAAYLLVRKGIPVTLLESGDTFQRGLLVRAMGRNMFRRVPPLDQKVCPVGDGVPSASWYRNLSPGGLSNQWTGAVPRFSPGDLTEGGRLHERYRWPISYDDLAPYYDIVEPLMHITSSQQDVPNLPRGKSAFSHHLPEDWQSIGRLAEGYGQGLTAMPLADGSPNLLLMRGTAFNSYSCLIAPLLKSPHFKLITGAHVLRLEWNNARQIVDSVLYARRSDGIQHRISADAVIVACGPLASTKLLFNSTCKDFPDGLGNSQGILGQYLHDHPKDWLIYDTDRPLTLLSPAAYLTRLPYEQSAPLLATSWTLGTTAIKEKIASRFGLKGTSFGVQIFGTMVPSPHHFVRPARTDRDAFGMPDLDIHICFDQATTDNMVRARQRLVDLMTEAGYPARVRRFDPVFVPGVSVHYGGTARMHHSPKYGVVDQWNRLYDCPNVIVCDASCFTTGPEKNPTLTVMAIAARAADRLIMDLKRR